MVRSVTSEWKGKDTTAPIVEGQRVHANSDKEAIFQ